MSEINRKSSSKLFFILTCIFGGILILQFLPTTIGAFVEAFSLGSFWSAVQHLLPVLAIFACAVLLLLTFILNHTDSNEIGCLLAIAMLIITLLGGFEFTTLPAFLGTLANIGLIILLMGYSVSNGKYRTHPTWLIICVCLCTMYMASLVAQFWSFLWLLVTGELNDSSNLIASLLSLSAGILPLLTYLSGFLSFHREVPTPVSKARTIVLSALLGTLGADRFYLGYTGLGIFKLLTGGCFGVLYIIDLIRICTGNLKPADGSNYASAENVSAPMAATEAASSVEAAE